MDHIEQSSSVENTTPDRISENTQAEVNIHEPHDSQSAKNEGEKISAFNELDELTIRIKEVRLDLVAKQKQERNYYITSFVLTLLTIAIVYWGSSTAWSALPITLTIVISFFAFMILIAAFGTRLNVDKLNAELEILGEKRGLLSRFEGISSRAPKSETYSYFNELVQINVENLSEYYTLIKVHTGNSFRASMFAGLIGFFLILIGLTVGFINIAETQFLAYSVTGAGILVEFIAGIFFILYNRTIRELKGYHDSLLVVQNILLSFKIVEDIDDPEQKANMIGKMLEFLMVNPITLNNSSD